MLVGTLPDLPAPPKVPNGKELYDMIMSKIEPELLSAELPLLNEKYGNEPDDLKKARLARYGEAFKKYDEAYATYMNHLRQQIKQYKTGVFSWAEQAKGMEEGEQMETLTTQISAQ